MIRTFFFVMFFMLFARCFAQQHLVSSLNVEGNSRTKTVFLKRIIKVRAGDLLDSVVIANDIRRLSRLPSVARANFEVIISKESCQVIYHIEDNFTLIPYANLFSSSNDDFAFRVGLQEFNFLGRNITLGGFYQLDVFNSVGLSFRAPYLFSPKLGISLNYHNITTQEPVFFNNTTADYRYNNKAVEVLGLYEFNTKNRVEFGFSPFTEEYSYLSGASSNEVPKNLTVKKHLLKLIYDYNALEYFYQYVEGFRSNLNLQYVGSSSASAPKFIIGFNDFTYFRRIGEKGNWASRLRLGLASNVDTPFAPFSVDNNLNIRGVGNTIDRGTGAVVFNTEYRHTLVDRRWFVLQSNIFVDGGSWRNPGGGLGDFADSQNIRIYPGVGLRFMHKKIFNAIFRIDYGYGITKEGSKGLVFGIGQYF